MARKTNPFYWNESSSSAANTVKVGTVIAGFNPYDFINFDVKIVGPTGGPVDVVLQKRIVNGFSGANVWIDFIHFAQVAAGATKYYNVSTDEYDATPIATTFTDDAATAYALGLAAGAIAHGHPGDVLRLLTVTGAGVTVAAAVTIYATGRQRN